MKLRTQSKKIITKTINQAVKQYSSFQEFTDNWIYLMWFTTSLKEKELAVSYARQSWLANKGTLEPQYSGD